MKKRGWINLGLLALVTLLGLAILFSPEEKDGDRFEPLTGLDPAQINRIRISNNNGPAFTLARQGKGWQMLSPYKVAANVPRINILLDIVSTPSFERFPLPRDRLAEFGLDKPRAELQLNDTTLIFGATHPYNYRRYVRIGDTLHLTNDLFPHHVQARAEAFISHQLFTDEQKIHAIHTAEWQLDKINNQWRLSPENPGLSMDQLVSKVDDWQHALAMKVEKAPAKRSPVQIQISLTDTPTAVIFELIRQKSRLLLVRRDLGIAYQLPVESTLTEVPK